MLRRSIVAGVTLLAISASAQAQLIDMGDYRAPKMHASASSSMLILTSIVDGVTASTWDFRAAQHHRASLDITIGDATSVGLVVGYASVPTSFSRRRPIFDSSSCRDSCDVKADFWSAALSLHVGDKPGFHQILEGTIGFNSLGNFRHTSDEKVGPASRDIDFSFSIGCGLGYSVSRRLQINLVQDLGFSVHGKSGSVDTPTNSLNPMLITRLGIRAGIGR